MGIKRIQQVFFILALVVFLCTPKMLRAQVPDNVDSSDCSIPPPPKDFDIKLKWRTPHYAGTNDAHSHGRSTPLVGDVDGDGEVEIVVPWSPNTSNNSNDALRPNTFLTRNLNVLNGKTGALKYQIKTCDFSVHGQAIAMADVNGDGKSEIFIVAVGTRASTTKQQYGGKYVYCYDGSKANTTSEDCIWKSADTVYRSYIPLIADINYDGTPELVVGRHIFNAITGRVLLKGTMNATGLGYGGPHNVNGEWQNKKKQELGEQYYMCAVADMDGDGNLEICAGNTIYKLTINSPNSMSNNKFKVLRQCTAALPYNDIYDGQTFVLDFDNDGDLDVCVIGRRTDELPSNTFSNGTNHIGFYVWDGQTPDLIGYFICDPHTFSLSIPFAADIDGDGFPEVIANGWILGHYYNANTNPDMMHVFRYKAGYTSSANNTQARNIEEIFSRTQAGEYCESAGFTVFDFNQDGKSEIVFRGPSSLYILDGSSLTKLCEPMSVASGTTAEYPIVADVDMDGHADIIVTEEYNSSNGSGGCVSVFESKTPNAWGPARKVWNQWPYNVVNINEDMSVPQYLFNITTPFGTGANVRKPFNAFLQQATKLTKDGVMFYPAPDANLVQDISAIRSICDSVVMDLCFSNEGSAPLTAPYGLTVYKDEYRGEVLRTRIFPTDLEPKDTMCVHLSFKASEIKELLPIERYVVTINDIGTGIEKEGGQQEECDTTNNRLGRAFEDLKFTAHYDTTVTICSNKMPFYFIDRYLKTGGDYGFALKTSQDCDSIVMLHLRVKDPVHNVETLVACDSLRWHGEKYTESGTYEYDYTNDAGCPSTDTLHLTVNRATHNVEKETVCESYEWHGEKYTESGAYTYDYTNTDGCPSTDTLHLTVNYGTHNAETEVACDSFMWHGTKYIESGTYEYDYT
ncbi:MAG: hypothetical protein IJU33_00530, partial [Bacteroidales bacterium]|nr:hypothetical protein [Bacteroidales bacterium]